MTWPARWLVVEVRVPSEALVAALAEGLVLSGGSAVEEVEGGLRTWLPDPGNGSPAVGDGALDPSPRSPAEAPPEVRERLAAVAAALTIIAPDEPWVLRWWWQAEEDWSLAWRRGLGARRAGAVVVAPTWVETPLAAGEVLVRIDPKMAFGTGEHPTTRGVLRLLQQARPAGARVLDVGAGSAVLAIAAARLGARAVRAVEADADAIDNALENVALNGVRERVAVEHAMVDAAWLAAHRGGGWQVILANVLSSVLGPLLPALRAALAPDGRLILGGILTVEAPGMERAAAQAELALRATDVEREWWSGLFTMARASAGVAREGVQSGP
jgi:ribosomal protein L11 methyltransferase